MTRNPRALAALVGLLFAVALLSGCLAGDEEPGAPEDGAENEAEDGDAAPEEPVDPGEEPDGGEPEAPEEPPCTLSLSALDGFAHEGPATPDPTTWDPASADPVLLLSQVGNSTFTIAPGTTSIFVTAAVGQYVTLGWSVALLDPSGAEKYRFESGGPNAAIDGVTGEPVLETDAIAGPAPGEWTIHWVLSGYIEGLDLTLEAQVCQ